MTTNSNIKSKPVYCIKKPHGIRIDIFRNTRKKDGMPFHTATVYRSYFNKKLGEWVDTNAGLGEQHGPPMIEALVHANAKIQQLNSIEQELFREQQHRKGKSVGFASPECSSSDVGFGGGDVPSDGECNYLNGELGNECDSQAQDNLEEAQ